MYQLCVILMLRVSYEALYSKIICNLCIHSKTCKKRPSKRPKSVPSSCIEIDTQLALFVTDVKKPE